MRQDKHRSIFFSHTSKQRCVRIPWWACKLLHLLHVLACLFSWGLRIIQIMFKWFYRFFLKMLCFCLFVSPKKHEKTGQTAHLCMGDSSKVVRISPVSLRCHRIHWPRKRLDPLLHCFGLLRNIFWTCHSSYAMLLCQDSLERKEPSCTYTIACWGHCKGECGRVIPALTIDNT